jgi:hypothetical protein
LGVSDTANANIALGLVPPKDIGSAVFTRCIRPFYNFVRASNLLTIWQKSVAQAIGANAKNGAVSWDIREGGEQGELKFSVENHFRAIGDHKLNITTAQRPVIQCGAANSDKRSLEQTMLADGLVEFHLTERELERLLRMAAKKAVYQSEGFIEATWDAMSGDDVGAAPADLGAALDAQESGEPPPPARPMKSGEPAFFCLGPLDVVRDVRAQSWSDAVKQWVVTRRWVNKYELVARYPEKREKILGLQFSGNSEFNARVENMRGMKDGDTDLVPFWTLYIPRGVIVEEGRLVTLASEDCVFFDGPMPYRRVPLAREAPDEIEGTPFGWTPMFDLLGPQEIVNAADTIILSNQSRAVGNIMQDDDANVTKEQISGNFNIFTKKRGTEVAPMEFPATPAEFFSYKDQKIAGMQALVGTNGVAMGTPNAEIGNDSSGAKLALITETAMRNNSGFEQSHVDAVRDTALNVIHLYRDFGGSLERKVKIAGKSRGYLVKSFTADDLADIDRVKVDVGNPMLRTTAGKMAVADKAVELGIIKQGELDKYLHLLREGTADPLLEVEQSQLLRIRGENEALLEGQQVHRALISDPHWKEIPEHLSLLDNPSLREPTPEAQAIQQAVLAAVQDHINQFQAMPPWMVLMRGGPEALAMWQQIATMGAPPMPGEPTQTPPPVPGAPSGTPPPKKGDASQALNPAGSKPGLPGMPSMPTSPLTGEPTDLSAPPGAPLQ